MARAVEAERQGFSELGVPGPPLPDQPKAHWPQLSRGVYVGTTVGRSGTNHRDHYVWPAKFPLSASVAVVDGPKPSDIRLLDARMAARMGLTWETTLMLGLRQGLLCTQELWGDAEALVRDRLFDEMEWRAYAIPNCGGDPWDPSVHGQEVSGAEDSEAYAVISWKPGRYRFDDTGVSPLHELHMPGERGNVPAREPSQRVLRGMHDLLTQSLLDS